VEAAWKAAEKAKGVDEREGVYLHGGTAVHGGEEVLQVCSNEDGIDGTFGGGLGVLLEAPFACCLGEDVAYVFIQLQELVEGAGGLIEAEEGQEEEE
jgi:hypothetical protein